MLVEEMVEMNEKWEEAVPRRSEGTDRRLSEEVITVAPRRFTDMMLQLYY